MCNFNGWNSTLCCEPRLLVMCTKNAQLFWRAWECKMLVHLTGHLIYVGVLWQLGIHILWPFGMIVVVWYIFARFGMFCQKIWQHLRRKVATWNQFNGLRAQISKRWNFYYSFGNFQKRNWVTWLQFVSLCSEFSGKLTRLANGEASCRLVWNAPGYLLNSSFLKLSFFSWQIVSYA
jgi:hypothetical protein